MPENYHSGRCNLSSNLLDPASDDDKIFWADQLLPGTFQCADLEDKNKYYKFLGCSKITSDEDVTIAFRDAKTTFNRIALINHRDKANGDKEKEAIFADANNVYETQKLAIHILGLGNKRVDYDEEGEALREMFEEAFEAWYPTKTFTGGPLR